MRTAAGGLTAAAVSLAATTLLLLSIRPALAMASQSPLTVVVSGATGKVGSRLVRRLLRDGRPDVGVNVVALVRDADRARSMFGVRPDPDGYVADDGERPLSPPSPSLHIVEADYADSSAVDAAFDDVDLGGTTDERGSGRRLRLFLACGNVPRQSDLEINVARAARRRGFGFCAKLSSTTPIVDSDHPYGEAHRVVEAGLAPGGCAEMPSCVFRPSVFLQMLSDPEGILGVDLRDSDEAYHPLADSDVSYVDCDDVAACAASVLLSDDPASEHGGRVYDLTGPEAARLGERLESAVSAFRPRPVRISELPTDELAEGLGGFLNLLSRCDHVSPDVERLTGRLPRSVDEFVRDDPAPFLPRTYRRLVGSGRAPSFREAARVAEVPLDDEASALADDEVLVRVRVAGVNGGRDTLDCARATQDAKDFPLGHEGTGIVVLRGKDVTRFRPGDTAVFVASGGYSEYVRAKERQCAAVPKGSARGSSSPAELTALRISALTALVALELTAPAKAGDVVLVTACCGGTGHFAAQIAKRMGATVVGTVGSPAKVAAAEALGADRVVDLSREDPAEVLREEYPRGVDIAYEGVGGALLKAVCDNLADGGRILLVGGISQYPHNAAESVERPDIEGLGDDVMDVFWSGRTVELDRGRKIIGNVWGGLIGSDKVPEYRDRVFELFAEGELRPIVDPVPAYDLNNVCDAVEHMLSRKSIGKVCAIISD